MPTRPKPAVGSAGDPVAQLTCLGIEKYVGRYYSRSTVGPLITLLLPSDSGSLQDISDISESRLHTLQTDAPV